MIALDQIKSAIAPYLLWIKLGVVAALVIAAVVLVGKHDARIDAEAYGRGYNARVAEEAAITAKVKAEADRMDKESAHTSAEFHQTLGIALPKIEATTDETQARIITIYRDRPVSAACVRPAGVLRDLDAARARANAAAAPASGL